MNTQVNSEISTLIEQWKQAVTTKDVDKIVSFYAQDIVAFDAVTALQFKGRKAYKAHWQACMEMCPGGGIFEFHQMNIVAAADSAFAAAVTKAEATSKRDGEGAQIAAAAPRIEGGGKPGRAAAVVSETDRYWFACYVERSLNVDRARPPSHATTRNKKRVGDVQLSFAVVRLSETSGKDGADVTLAAGRGRSGPQALPEPSRPARQQHFWLSSAWNSALVRGWARYRRAVLTSLCLSLLLGAVYLFFSTGVETESRKVFE